jgi:trehalose 6-phosphate phosphatase
MPLSTSADMARLAIFTDFDGTLVELAQTPKDVAIAEDLADRIERTMADLDSAFAVITGRPIDDIDRFLAPLTLPVAGAHGTERRRADGSLEQADPQLSEKIDRIEDVLLPLVATHPELILERKPGTIALHYRQAPQLEPACRIAIQEAVGEVEDFSVTQGKMVYEARPDGIDKGAALRAFMNEEPFAGRTPIFIGDDLTDEDAFRAAQELGGVGIKLGAGDTVARMRIADVASVHALLSGLGDVAQGRIDPQQTH